MRFAWIGLIIEIIVWSFFRPFIEDTETSAAMLVGINAFIVMISFLKEKGFYINILFPAYLLRLFAMIWDIYASDIFILPNSGGDAIGFFYSAEAIAGNIDLITGQIYGGLYAKIVGSIFAFVGAERLIGQYINVLLGMTTIIFLYKTLLMLKVNKKIVKRSLFIIAFFPNAVVLSGIFLREAIISTFIMISVYFFVKWYCHKNYNYMLFSTVYLLIASAFHAGVVGIFVGYVFFYMFYKHDKKSFASSYKSVGIFVFFVSIALVIATQFNEVLLLKFASIENMEDIYSKAALSLGESAYLTGIEINSLIDVLFYGPIKMFYFLASPLPMDWRGFADIIAFFMDGSFYLGVIVYGLLNFKHLKNNPIAVGILIILLITSFIFGLGSSNAGTAIRHRHKILPIFLILLAVMLSGKQKFKVTN